MTDEKLAEVVARIHMLHETFGDGLLRSDWDTAPNQTAVDNILEVLHREHHKFREIIIGPLPCGGFGMECYTKSWRGISADWWNWICSNTGWVILEAMTHDEVGYEETVLKTGTTPDFWKE